MQLSNIVSASLGLLVLATAKPYERGDHLEGELRPERHDNNHRPQDLANHEHHHSPSAARDITSDDFSTTFVNTDGQEFTSDHRFENVKLPHPHARIVMDKRAQETWYGMYECSKPEYKGECHWRLAVPVGKKYGPCMNRLWGDNPNVSLGIDKGLLCKLYEEKDCKGHYANEKYGYVMNWKTSDRFEDFHDPLSYICNVITFGDPYVEAA